MAYRDFCVSALDKVDGVFCFINSIRSLDRDAIVNAWLDDSDPFVAGVEGLPRKLELWEQVTRPGMFFDPLVRGFNSVEFYDPAYYMHYTGSSSQSCFHPMYRGRTRYSFSVVSDASMAFWYSKYAEVKATPPGCIEAPSVHMGFPLWFFNREQADSLATAIFKVWQLPLIDEQTASD
jgi:hypothetical protein